MTQATLILHGKRDRETAARWAMEAPPGTVVTFKTPRRTHEQNSLMWAMLTDIARQVEWYGQYLSAEDWKDVMSASLRRARVVPGLDAGTFVPLGMRTSSMTRQEFSDLIELIHAFAAERGVVFSKPEGEAP